MITDLDITSVLVFVVQNAGSITRVPGEPVNGAHLTDRSFVLNTRETFNDQYCLHGGVRQSMVLVGMHDIDCRGRVWTTSITDTAHPASGNPPYAVRGVEDVLI